MVKKWKNNNMGTNPAGPVYFFGMIGAAVFYIKAAVGAGAVITGLLKALVWPAFLVYHLLGL